MTYRSSACGVGFRRGEFRVQLRQWLSGSDTDRGGDQAQATRRPKPSGESSHSTSACGGPVSARIPPTTAGVQYIDQARHQPGARHPGQERRASGSDGGITQGQIQTGEGTRSDHEGEQVQWVSWLSTSACGGPVSARIATTGQGCKDFRQVNNWPGAGCSE